MTEREVVNRLAWHFGWRQNTIVNNVSWGFFNDNREVDLLIVRPSGWCEEIEIKLTATDIKADALKTRHKRGIASDLPPQIKAKWFCVPVELADHDAIPDYCGVYTWSFHDAARSIINIHRAAKLNPRRRKLTDAEHVKLLQLAHMRLWNYRASQGK